MEPTDFITDYKQVKNVVEGTYEYVTGREFPEDVMIRVCDATGFELILYTWLNYDVVAKPEKKLYYKGEIWSGTRGLYNPVDKKIVVINNPAFVAIPDIFHEIGHHEYQRNGCSDTMDEICAYLYEDAMFYALTHELPKNHNSQTLYDFFDYNFNHRVYYDDTLDELHKKGIVLAREFRTRLISFNEKAELLLRCSSPEELERELDMVK